MREGEHMIYEKPKMELIQFEDQDIVTSSDIIPGNGMVDGGELDGDAW